MKKHVNDALMVLLTLPSLAGALWMLLIFLTFPRPDQSPIYLYFAGKVTYLPFAEIVTGGIGLFYYRATSRSWPMFGCLLLTAFGLIFGGLLCLIYIAIFNGGGIAPDS
jgi:hypothetical protein